ncbi:hypothetical protein F9Z43_17800 [Pseudomonas monteilii]|uniref:Uncharacterized protein n=2 Tax=Pseudomonas TaxID=286 RepID=A0A7W2LFD9_9PSED|nr:hypothetical protein [Pseudomonas monteilii]MBV4515224.1 hypothetical protein [Pseudomonas kurunegalensis]MBZ3663453.1 hypothetical protein [Pseudomonas monteilii]MBZ3668779.1 hypothetical protein [Pseudomonas monteilii]MCA4076745.1 hypothetical protein [Pseudomonas kurunegalensis]
MGALRVNHAVASPKSRMPARRRSVSYFSLKGGN